MIKLKTLLEDTDQNNNGYPDSTEGNLARTNVNTYYTIPPKGFQFTNKPIDSQANKLLMNYWDNILNSQEKQQEYQDDRKAGNSNWRDGIELYNRYMLIAGRAENQLKVSGYITTAVTDQNNNGYPDSTEGNLVRTNVNAYYTTAPIAKADLIAKLEPLKRLFPKITDRDLKALTFVGTKSDTTKIYKALGALRVQDYFDPPNDDSEFSGSGTWVIDTMSASDEGLIK